MKTPALIRIVDDDPRVGASFRFVLEAVGHHVATYVSSEDFLEHDDFSREGCLLLDVRMPGLSGPELQLELKARGCDLPVIFLTAHGEVRMAVEALQEGAVDFLEKPVEAEILLPLIDKTCRAHHEIRALKSDLRDAERLWTTLSDAEREAAQLIGKGLPNRQIAELLETTEDAVRSRRASIFLKLDVHNAVELSEFLHDLTDLREAAR